MFEKNHVLFTAKTGESRPAMQKKKGECTVRVSSYREFFSAARPHVSIGIGNSACRYVHRHRLIASFSPINTSKMLFFVAKSCIVFLSHIQDPLFHPPTIGSTHSDQIILTRAPPPACHGGAASSEKHKAAGPEARLDRRSAVRALGVHRQKATVRPRRRQLPIHVHALARRAALHQVRAGADAALRPGVT